MYFPGLEHIFPAVRIFKREESLGKKQPLKSQHKNNIDQTLGLSAFPPNSPMALRSGLIEGNKTKLQKQMWSTLLLPSAPFLQMPAEGLGKLLNLSKPQLLEIVIPSSEGFQRINVYTQQMVAISIVPQKPIQKVCNKSLARINYALAGSGQTSSCTTFLACGTINIVQFDHYTLRSSNQKEMQQKQRFGVVNEIMKVGKVLDSHEQHVILLCKLNK